MSLKNFVLCTTLLCTSSFTIAQDLQWGIAGSLGTGSAIRLPITNGNFVIEPFLARYQNNENETDPINENTAQQIGTGFWKIFSLQDKFSLRTGVEVAYVEESSHYQSGDYVNKSDLDGYAVAPSLGIFYEINSRLFIGAEASYNISRMTGTTKPGFQETTTESKKRSEHTGNQVVMEFYF